MTSKTATKRSETLKTFDYGELGRKRNCPKCGLWFYDMISRPGADVIVCPCSERAKFAPHEFLKLRNVRAEADAAALARRAPAETEVEVEGTDLIEDSEELADEGEIGIEKGSDPDRDEEDDL